MKHPDREQWIPFIYGEANPEDRSRLEQHLEQCPECAREIAGWRRSLRRLDRWRLPKLQPRSVVAFPAVIKWAVAAAVVLGMGLFIGRSTVVAGPGPAVLRAQIESSVRASLATELRNALEELRAQHATELAAAETRFAKVSAVEAQRVWSGLLEVLNNGRSEDARAVQALFQEAEEREDAKFVAVRKDLETLASTADEEIRQARFKLMQLADLRSSNE